VNGRGREREGKRRGKRVGEKRRREEMGKGWLLLNAGLVTLLT